MTDHTTASWRLRAVRWLGLWTVLGLAFSARTWLAKRLADGDPWPLWRALRADLPDWYLWGFAALALPALLRRWPLDHRSWRTNLPIHAGFGLGIPLLHLVAAVVVQEALRTLAGEPYAFVNRLVEIFMVFYMWNVIVYVAILGLAMARQYHHDLIARDVRAAQLEARLAEARLDALSRQLRPHFLFNALNGLSELMRSDPEAADQLLEALAELLRATIDTGGRAEVSLRRELGVADRYLAVQRIRFEDRLAVSREIEAETLDAAVPSLVLLPLIENAIVHGVGARPGPARVRVSARRTADALELEVWNEGEFTPGSPGGVGLANTRERLMTMYANRQRLTVGADPQGGVLARLRIPFQRWNE